jgi:hypothetical protein
MAKRQQKKIICEVTLTEGAVDRITQAFVDLYYGIQEGIYKYNGPPLDGKRHEKQQQKPSDETA